ncbi:MAG: permease [Pseudobdellovibrionaceae bacterium]
MDSQKSIPFSLAGLLTSVALILLAIVDFRRGFLFSKADYIAKSPFFVFSPLQLGLLILGFLGIYYFRRRVSQPHPQVANRFLIGIFVLLLLDAAFYRGVAASRALDAGKIGTDWLMAFGISGLLKPLALGASYVLTVWHAALLSCLGAGLGLLALPRLLRGLEGQGGWRGSVAGTLYSFTQPFCSCCVAMTSPGLFRSRHSMNFALAVLLGAPLMNISTLILAGNLLPWPFAVLRILGGLLITMILSFALSRWFLGESCQTPEGREQGWVSEGVSDSPLALLGSWLKLSGKVALLLIPSMILGTVLSSIAWNLWPQSMGNSISSVVLTSVIGSLVMVSTWSEIPLASQMIQQGMTGPAAAALVALPAVNLGSLLIIAKVSRNWKVAVGLGMGVMIAAMMVGIAFL